MNISNVEKQYDSMEHFYNVLYSGYNMKDWENEFINEYEDLLKNLKVNARVLDSSCGNGIQATALKRYGLNVIGTDISEEMINLTQQYAKDNNLFFPTKQLSWVELPDNFGEDFDIVFCYGNSICHSANKDELRSNIKALKKVTKNGGKIVIDTRNWDKILKDAVKYTTSDIKIYNNKKYILTYIWYLNGFNKRSSVEILFIEIINNKQTKCIPFKLDFTPFKYIDFIEILKACGLKIVKDNFKLNNDTYSIILEK